MACIHDGRVNRILLLLAAAERRSTGIIYVRQACVESVTQLSIELVIVCSRLNPFPPSVKHPLDIDRI